MYTYNISFFSFISTVLDANPAGTAPRELGGEPDPGSLQLSHGRRANRRVAHAMNETNFCANSTGLQRVKAFKKGRPPFVQNTERTATRHTPQSSGPPSAFCLSLVLSTALSSPTKKHFLLSGSAGIVPLLRCSSRP